MPKPPIGRRFQKGQSGNPGGQTREFGEVKKLAQQHGREAVDRLHYWAKSDNARASVAACTFPLQEAMAQSRHRSVQQAADYYNAADIERGPAARLG